MTQCAEDGCENAAAVELLDCHKDEAIGQHIDDLFPEVGSLVDDGEKRLQAEFSLERSGARRYYDVRVTPLHRARGVVTGHLVSLRDVTEKRQQRPASRLVSGREVDLSEPVILPPRTTMVLNLGAN